MISPCLCSSQGPRFGGATAYKIQTPGDWVKAADARYLNHLYLPKTYWPKAHLGSAHVEDIHSDRYVASGEREKTGDAFVMFGQQAHFSQDILNQPAAGQGVLEALRQAGRMLFGALQPFPNGAMRRAKPGTCYANCPAPHTGLGWWLG